jgi:PPK2 family polyphosphate:nucleotide phosphotransferase
MKELAYKVKPGQKVDLRGIDPSDTHGVARDEADAQVAKVHEKLTTLQEVHYAAGQNGILLVLQGLDTAGKDGTIRHVMAAFNPASCRVESFKVPTPDERAHDFLWRIHRATPPLGSITIFNRSHYEDVLVTRVHKLVPEETIEERYDHINSFEELLAESGTIVLKFFLYISKNEQRDRLLAREADKSKAWKLSASDWPEHELYGDYVEAYQLALSKCSTKSAPWFIVPSDKKWYRNYAVAEIVADAMRGHVADWQKELDERGKRQLAAIAALKQSKSK